tara:strand:+ start:1104 stop:1238 length:135 start_codon:yes stop_codon:yes gene_type:complete
LYHVPDLVIVEINAGFKGRITLACCKIKGTWAINNFGIGENNVL